MNINQGKQVGSRGSPCSGLHVAPALIRRPAGIVQYHATVFMYLLVCIRGNVYVRVETYTCVRVQAFASVYLCTCARARARVCVCVFVCVFVRACMRVCLCMMHTNGAHQCFNAFQQACTKRDFVCFISRGWSVDKDRSSLPRTNSLMAFLRFPQPRLTARRHKSSGCIESLEVGYTGRPS